MRLRRSKPTKSDVSILKTKNVLLCSNFWELQKATRLLVQTVSNLCDLSFTDCIVWMLCSKCVLCVCICYFRLDTNFVITGIWWSVSQSTIPAWPSDTVGTINGWTWSVWTGKLCYINFSSYSSVLHWFSLDWSHWLLAGPFSLAHRICCSFSSQLSAVN